MYPYVLYCTVQVHEYSRKWQTSTHNAILQSQVEKRFKSCRWMYRVCTSMYRLYKLCTDCTQAPLGQLHVCPFQKCMYDLFFVHNPSMPCIVYCRPNTLIYLCTVPPIYNTTDNVPHKYTMNTLLNIFFIFYFPLSAKNFSALAVN